MRQKIISWNICGGCNYHCSYCVQGKQHEGFPTAEQLAGFESFFRGLGDGWEVKISGGEPFCCPGFLDVVGWLREAGAAVSVVTNFSFPKRTYRRFLSITGDGLRTFSASLHREKVEWKKFLKKCSWIQKKIAKTDKGSLVINSVVVPGEAEALLEIKGAFEKEGLRFYPQLMRRNGRAVDYSPREKALIAQMAGDRNPFKINAGYSMKGATCYAGMNYFIISQDGSCYTCYPGKRDGQGRMGNIIKGDFRFRDEPIQCPYDICPCTVPINRGIVAF